MHKFGRNKQISTYTAILTRPEIYPHPTSKYQPGSFSTLPLFVMNGGEGFTTQKGVSGPRRSSAIIGCFGSFGCTSDRNLGKINHSASHIPYSRSACPTTVFSSVSPLFYAYPNGPFARLQLCDDPCSHRNFIYLWFTFEFRISDQMQQ